MMQTQTGLTPTEVEKFRRDGYLVCHRQLFPEPKFRRLQETFERILANAPPGKKPEDLDVPHYAYPELFEWLLADEALDVVEAVAAGDLTPEGRIADHLATCANCAAALESARRLERMLQSRTIPQPPSHFESFNNLRQVCCSNSSRLVSSALRRVGVG